MPGALRANILRLWSRTGPKTRMVGGFAGQLPKLTPGRAVGKSENILESYFWTIKNRYVSG
jgi:hypothetical protein